VRSWPTPTTSWQTDERRYLSEGSMALLYPDRDTELVAAIEGGE
jgi:putative transposase